MRPRVACATPFTEMTHSEVVGNWLNLHPRPEAWFGGQGSYLPEAHNRLVKEALEQRSWDRLLILENDHVLHPEIVTRCQQHRAEIVSGLYFGRRYPHYPPVYVKVDPDGTAHSDHRWLAEIIDKPGEHPIGGCGTGVLSVAREVFERLPFPWFEPSPLQLRLGSTGGHDIWFCRKAADAGFRVRLDTDPRMWAEHEGWQRVTVRHYMAAVQAEGVRLSA